MLKALIKKQLLELFQSYFVDRKTGKAKSKGGTAWMFVLFAFLMIALSFAFFAMASGLGAVLLGGDRNWLFFALMGLLSIVLGVFGSVFNTYAGLYLPKDNEFLLSLPIPAYKLLLSRMICVYLLSLMYSAWVWIPSIIAFWIMVPLTVLNVVFPILLTFILALFVSVLTCLLGWVVAWIASKAKGKNILTVIITLVALSAYYVIYFKIMNSLEEIIAHLDDISMGMKNWLYYLYLLGEAADGKVLSMILFTLITLALFVICMVILSRTFMKFAFAKERASKKQQKKEGFAEKSQDSALLGKEFRFFSSISAWMLNGGLGLVIMPVLAILAVVKCAQVRDVLDAFTIAAPFVAGGVPLVIFGVMALMVSTDCICPASISLEGKSIWILQTMPVDLWKVIKAKVKVSVLLNGIMAGIAVILLGIAMKVSFINVVLMTVLVMLYSILIAAFGLLMNLSKPNLTWTNPVVPVKQGMPVAITLFGGWLYCGVLAIGGFFLSMLIPTWLVLLLLIAICAACTMLVRRWLKTKGVKIFSEL